MYLFKTAGSTFDSVITNQKHAFKAKPSDWSQGETVLVSKNLADCIAGEKQIQCVMKLKQIRQAKQDELEGLWPGNAGRWNYIADCCEAIKLSRPFNLVDILGDGCREYGPVMTFKKISREHEAILNTFLEQQTMEHDRQKITYEVGFDEYIPISEADARSRTLASIVRRRGQVAFRKTLLSAYNGQCAVTGCDAIDTLEAAHISPYMGDHTDTVQNGLLLRADIHTLFDLGKISISPNDFVIILHPDLRKGHYGYLHGRRISVPKDHKSWPRF